MAKDEAKQTYWKNHIRAWQTSGLTRVAYCQREGIKPTSLDYWRSLAGADPAQGALAKPAIRGNGLTLVPVRVIDRPHALVPEVIRLKSPSGWEIHLPAQIEAHWLSTLLRQLP